MGIIRKVAVGIAAVLLLYLGLGFALAIWPFTRQPVATGIDFSVLRGASSDRREWVEEQYRARDGRMLFLRRVAGRTPLTVILIHGSGSEGRYLLRMAVQLAQTTGAEVVVPDLRGHGRSGPVTGDVAYLGQLADDLADLVQTIRTRVPQARIVLGGHSSGGGLVLRYAGTPSLERVDAYLLLAPYLGYDAPTTRQDSGGWVQVAVRRYIGLSMLNATGITVLNNLPVVYFNRPREWQDSLQADSYTYRLNESLSPRRNLQDLDHIDRQALVLVGENDEAFHADRYAGVFATHSPGVLVHVVGGARHLDLPDSADTLATVGSWLHEVGDNKPTETRHANK